MSETNQMRSQKFNPGRPGPPPKLIYPSELPILAKKEAILAAIRKNPVVIITGETGSGKTTQIPKMCLEAGRGLSGMIGCTQPRRIAAVSVARRIAEEMDEELGRSVGYKIRFDDCISQSTFIKFMTDGILLMEAQRDRLLNAYDTIIIDEAHERTLNIDFALGILKNILLLRRDLRVVITSATIDAEKFSASFADAPIIEVSGRVYPVSVRYEPIDHGPGEERENAVTYIDAAIKTVEDLTGKRDRGDILVFMPTEQDIRETGEALRGRLGPDAVVAPLFSRLSRAEQQLVFRQTPRRKIVIATNIAETSLTIPGIRYVVDTGLARISVYNPRSSTAGLPVRAISRSSADQRKGRCGRVESGVCIRLYSEEDYSGRPLYTAPEILRSNLAGVILRMLSLGLGEIDTFPFIDTPAPKSIHEGLETLQELGAIERNDSRKGWRLTKTGMLMARLPIDPRIARMIIEAKKENCLREILIIAAALSIQDPRERPSEKEREADRAHAAFRDPASDFISLLTIYNRIYPPGGGRKSQGQIRRFCRESFLSYRRIREWHDVQDQLFTILKEYRFLPDSNRKRREDASDTQGDHLSPPPKSGVETYAAIHRSILSGFLSHIALMKEKNLYTATKGRQVMIFPGSGLFKHGGNWIVAAEIVETSRLFARIVANIESSWLEQLGGDLCRRSYADPHWEQKRGEVVASEQVTLFGLTIIPGRQVSYGRIDPVLSSRIFTRSALVEGETNVPFPFLLHNRALRERISKMEEKVRRRDLLLDEERIAAFYEQRLPGVFDIRTLQRIIRDRGDDFLMMKEEDILAKEPDRYEISLYPDSVPVSGWSLDCIYHFTPGQPEDGVTIKIPAVSIPSLSAGSLDWSIPGLLHEKIAAMLRSLPKETRKKLMPLAKTTEIILREMPREGPLTSALRRFLIERFNIDIPANTPLQENIEERLKLRFSVVDQKGTELSSGRDESLLKEDFADDGADAVFETARRKLEKNGLTSWDVGEIPANIPNHEKGAKEFVFYPALQAEGNAVSYRIFKTAREARLVHASGVKALFVFRFGKELRDLRKALSPTGELKLWAAAFGGAKMLQNALCEKVEHDLFEMDIRTEKDFLAHAEKVRPTLMSKGQDISQTAAPVMEALYGITERLRVLERANRSNRPFLEFLAGLREELARLVPPDFLVRYEERRLRDIVRYLKAIGIRAERGAVYLQKALTRGLEVQEIEKIFEEIEKSVRRDSTEKKRSVEELRWMIEEYKVSLFAQELKTPYPISRKRLYSKIDEIKSMDG
jgi:ATP-dependent helicase HrpA